MGGKVKKAIARESEAIGTIAAAYSSISQAYTMLRFLYHQAVTNLVEQGGWEGTDEDGKGDAFLMRFGTLFENYCGRSALFGVFKIFQKLLFSILIGTVGDSFVQSTAFSVIHFLEILYLVIERPHIDITANFKSALKESSKMVTVRMRASVCVSLCAS